MSNIKKLFSLINPIYSLDPSIPSKISASSSVKFSYIKIKKIKKINKKKHRIKILKT
jgi:hypothetical protein